MTARSSLVTPPSVPILQLGPTKAHLRVDGDDEDLVIGGYIQAATDYLEARHGILGRALVTQTWRLTQASFTSQIDLPVTPLQSVSSVNYYDKDNVAQVVPSSDYRVVADDDDPYIELVSGASWPVAYNRPDAVWVDYVAGYGGVEDVPEAIRQAAHILVAGWFQNREPVSQGAAPAIEFSVKMLLTPYRRASGLF